MVKGGGFMPITGPASPMYWRLNREVYTLVGMKCNDCGHITYPRRKVCPGCGSFNTEDFKLSRTGTVHTYCINYVLPSEIEPPAPLCILDLDTGGRYQGLFTEVAKPEDIRIGDKVELVLRKLYEDRGLPLYGYKARLVKEV
jgi:uncharacterized OB-fold protein